MRNTVNNNFYVRTINSVNSNNKKRGYIIVSEIANDILVAVDERKNFILRTVISVGIVSYITHKSDTVNSQPSIL